MLASTTRSSYSSRLTSYIYSTVTAISIQIIIWEAGPSHQPRSFSNYLWGISVGVAVNTVEHFPIAIFWLSHGMSDGLSEIESVPNYRANVVSGEYTLVFSTEFIGDHNERHFVCSQSAKIGFGLSVRVSLFIKLIIKHPK
jgi:hypothetical protein